MFEAQCARRRDAHGGAVHRSSGHLEGRARPRRVIARVHRFGRRARAISAELAVGAECRAGTGRW